MWKHQPTDVCKTACQNFLFLKPHWRLNQNSIVHAKSSKHMPQTQLKVWNRERGKFAEAHNDIKVNINTRATSPFSHLQQDPFPMHSPCLSPPPPPPQHTIFPTQLQFTISLLHNGEWAEQMFCAYLVMQWPDLIYWAAWISYRGETWHCPSRNLNMIFFFNEHWDASTLLDFTLLKCASIN